MIRLLSKWIVIPGLILACCAMSGPETPAATSAYSPDGQWRIAYREHRGLQYLLAEPVAHAATEELPLLVYLHGRGGQPEVPRGAFLGVRTPVRIIIPQAPDAYRDGFSWMPVSAHRGESPALNDALQRRTERLANALIHWRQVYPTTGAPLVVGFSQGGILTMNLAMHHPETMHAAFPIAGWLPPSLEPRTGDPYAIQPAVHAFHGEADEVLSASRTRALIHRMRALGYPLEFQSYPNVGHETSPEMREALRQRIEMTLQRMAQVRVNPGLS